MGDDTVDTGVGCAYNSPRSYSTGQELEPSRQGGNADLTLAETVRPRGAQLKWSRLGLLHEIRAARSMQLTVVPSHPPQTLARLKVTSAVSTRPPQLKEKAAWVADAARVACYCCGQQFTRTLRRHHCRFCGEVVCARYLPLPHARTFSTAMIFSPIGI
jgi:hypothetical protein